MICPRSRLFSELLCAVAPARGCLQIRARALEYNYRSLIDCMGAEKASAVVDGWPQAPAPPPVPMHVPMPVQAAVPMAVPTAVPMAVLMRACFSCLRSAAQALPRRC